MNWIPVDKINIETGWIFTMGQNMHGYSFVSGFFPRYPTFQPVVNFSDTFLNSYFATALEHTRGYSGFDAIVLGNLAVALNFTSTMVTSNRYGDRLPNGSFTGTLTKNL